MVPLGVRSGLRTRRAGEGLRNVKTGGLEGRVGLRGRLDGLSADFIRPLAVLAESLVDRDGLLMRRAEPEVDRNGLLAVRVAPRAPDDGLRVLVVLVTLRACLDGLRVGLDGCLVRLAGLRGGLKLRARGTGTGLEAKRMAAAEVRRDKLKDGDTRDSIPSRTSGLEGIATCEERQ